MTDGRRCPHGYLRHLMKNAEDMRTRIRALLYTGAILAALLVAAGAKWKPR